MIRIYLYVLVESSLSKLGDLHAHAHQRQDNPNNALKIDRMRTESPSQPDNDARLELTDHRPTDGSRQVDNEKLREIHQGSKDAALWLVRRNRGRRWIQSHTSRIRIHMDTGTAPNGGVEVNGTVSSNRTVLTGAWFKRSCMLFNLNFLWYCPIHTI